MNLSITVSGLPEEQQVITDEFNIRAAKANDELNAAQDKLSGVVVDAEVLTFAQVKKACSGAMGKIYELYRTLITLAEEQHQLLDKASQTLGKVALDADANHEAILAETAKALRAKGLGAKPGMANPDTLERKLSIVANEAEPVHRARNEMNQSARNSDNCFAALHAAANRIEQARTNFREFTTKLVMLDS